MNNMRHPIIPKAIELRANSFSLLSPSDNSNNSNNSKNSKFRNSPDNSNKHHDNDDQAQECGAYLKTKLFMAKRIAEQQAEIESLKEQLFYHSNRHAQMYEILKNINDNLAKKSNASESSSSEQNSELVQSVIIDDENEKEKEFDMVNTDTNMNVNMVSKKDLVLVNKIGNENGVDPNTNTNNIIFNTGFDNLDAKQESNANTQKIMYKLKAENLELRRQSEISKVDNKGKDVKISKLLHDKFILFSELSELVTSLKKVDLNAVNDFYTKSAARDNDWISSMGIKYNILSAQSQMILLQTEEAGMDKLKFDSIMSDLTDNKFIESNFNNFYNYNNRDNFINLEKYLGLIKAYENELNAKSLEK